jgi:SAM-dependent methyltransferase
MDRKEREKGTLDYYNQTAEKFHTNRTPNYWESELKIFHELLPSGKILEIGCGSGIEAKKLIDQGYTYVGLDNSLSMLKIAKANLPEGNFVCADLRDSSINGKFDGFLAIASLLHISKNEMLPALATIKEYLSPQAIGIIVMKQGEGEETNDRGQFYNYYSPDEYSHVLKQVGFTIEQFSIRPDRNHDYLFYFVSN